MRARPRPRTKLKHQVGYKPCPDASAEVCIHGTWYKRGTHGKVYRYSDGDWLSSTLDQSDFDNALASVKKAKKKRGQS